MAQTCPKCGKFLKGEFSFCPHCGSKIEKEVKKPEPVKEVVKAPVQEPIKIAEPKVSSDSTRYNAQFKSSLFFEFLSNVFSVLFGLCILFIPVFVNDYKVNDAPMQENFSIFKIALNFLKGFENLASLFLFYDFIVALVIASMIVTSLVSLVKNLINLINLEKYYLVRYDNLINRVEERTRFRSKRNYNSFSFFVTTVSLFVIVIVYDRLPYIGTHYFDGVNAFVALPIVFLVITFVFALLKMSINSKIKTELLKETYKK